MQPYMRQEFGSIECGAGIRVFRSPVPGETRSVLTKKKPAGADIDPESLLRCRQCSRGITDWKQKIEKDGAHTHVFTNPHDITFGIACFDHAPGCVYTGPIVHAHSWFAGYGWRIAVCGACSTHLGWLFVAGGDRFHGLIKDRLVSQN